MNTVLRPALVLLLILTLITGIVYPFVVTGLAAVLFPHQASGSLVLRDGKPIGSSLIGQAFSEPKYFWSRPSATSPQPYNGLASGGSNLGPLNPALTDAVKARVDALRAADPGNTASIGDAAVGDAPLGRRSAWATLRFPPIAPQFPRLLRNSADASGIPVDLVTASASGLDPDISVAAANYQAARVARVRGLNVGVVQALIAEHARGRLFGWLGEPRVNVLQLNLALDEVHAPRAP